MQYITLSVLKNNTSSLKKYHLLRWAIYRHEIKKITAALKQFFIFYAALMFVSLPAVILMSLISLSVIADSHTLLDQRITYQWIYFVLLYFMIRVQKNAILGQSNQHYLSSLPIKNKIKNASTLVLTVIAGNLPLIAPFFLLAYIPDTKTFINQLYFPLFAFTIIIVTWSALQQRGFPWLSLFLTPLLVNLSLSLDLSFIQFLWVEHTELTLKAISLNSLWLLLLTIEVFVKPLTIDLTSIFNLKFYWKIRWLAILKNPMSAMIRIFITSLCISLMAYLQYKVLKVANIELQVAAVGLIALIIGSYQFETEKFYQAHPHYLNNLLTNKYYRYFVDCIPMMLIAFSESIVMWRWLDFSVATLWLLPLGAIITIISVTRFERNFFIIPLLFHGLVAFIYFIISSTRIY